MNGDGSRQRFLVEGSDARWSPMGDRILFMAKDDDDKPQIFVRWMSQYTAVSQVTRCNGKPVSPVWSPDSKQVVFDAVRVESELAYRQSKIYRINIADQDVTQLTLAEGHWSTPTVSHDGNKIVYLGFPASKATYVMNKIYMMDIDGGNPVLLAAELDRPTTGRQWWSADDKSVFFSARYDGYINVSKVDLRGKVSPVTSGRQVVRLDSVDSNMSRGVGVLSSFYEPGDVYSFNLSGRAEMTRLTKVNDDLLTGKTLGETEELWFEAEDGNKAHGWMIKPPGFDENKMYPLLMEIHGGPFGMYQGHFNFNYQVFAANGFVVLYTNPRGSTGYGEKFSQAIDHAYPSVDYLDLMAGVDAALDKGYIDEQRLYVGGCSGGVLTSWVIGYTDRFAAASVRCPVSNWVSFLGQTDIPNFALSFFEKPFWEDPSDWLHHSPIMYVGNVKTPTLVMTGEQDLRTPMAQSEEYYAALQIAGVSSRLLRFNDQYHGTGTHPSNAMRTMLYLMSWYNDHDINGKIEKQ